MVKSSELEIGPSFKRLASCLSTTFIHNDNFTQTDVYLSVSGKIEQLHKHFESHRPFR